MKKAALLILAILLLPLCACGQNAEEFSEPVNFYYCNEEISYNTPDGVIRAEVREAADFYGNPQAMLRAYLSGPTSAELVSPFPKDTKLVSFSVDDGTAYLTLSREVSSLSGVRLSAACSCVTLTLVEYAPVTEVHIRAEEGLLDNKDEVILKAADIVMMDELFQKG